MKVTLDWGATSCLCTSTDQFSGQETRSTYDDHAKQSHVLSLTDTRGYLILRRETARKIVYIQFLKITPWKLTQQPKMLVHLKAIKMKTSRQEAASEKDQGPRCLRIKLFDGAVLMTGKKHRLPIMKEYMLKEYSDVFSGVGTLPGKEYHIALKKDYVLVQHSQDQSQSRSRQHIKENYSDFVMKELSHLFRSTQSDQLHSTNQEGR